MQQAERTKPQEKLALPTVVKIMEGCDEQIQRWAATADEALPSTTRVPIQINTVLLEQVVSDLASAKVKERIMRIAHELSLTQEEFATFETFIRNTEVNHWVSVVKSGLPIYMFNYLCISSLSSHHRERYFHLPLPSITGVLRLALHHRPSLPLSKCTRKKR